jgi:hypothetical protein
LKLAINDKAHFCVRISRKKKVKEKNDSDGQSVLSQETNNHEGSQQKFYQVYYYENSLYNLLGSDNPRYQRLAETQKM